MSSFRETPLNSLYAPAPASSPAPSVDLWPHHLFWRGDPRALAFFCVKVRPGEPGPWRGRRPWTPWRQKSAATKSLDRWFRNNEPHLREDAFATINRFCRWYRTQEYVIRLGAAFVDIDCGRSPADVTAAEAEATLDELVRRGALPQPSLLQSSGRGLWAFWLLQDQREPDTAAFASPRNKELWTRLQGRMADVITAETKGLKIDRNALDISRVTRLEGSINSSNGQAVSYRLLPSPDGQPLRYTIDDLAQFHGLQHAAVWLGGGESDDERRDLELEEHRRRQDERQQRLDQRRITRKGVDPQLSAWGMQGHIKLWQGRLQFLERVRVEEYGGAIPQGNRFLMLSAYAYCFAQLTRTVERCEASLLEVWRKHCEQPLIDRFSAIEVRRLAERAVDWTEKAGKITNRRFAELAGLDPVRDRAKIGQLGLNLDTGLKGRDQRAETRRALAQEIVGSALRAGNRPPSARELARKLTEQGCQTGHSTAHTVLMSILSVPLPAEGARSVSPWKGHKVASATPAPL